MQPRELMERLEAGEAIAGTWWWNWQAKEQRKEVDGQVVVVARPHRWNLYAVIDATRITLCQADRVDFEVPCSLVREYGSAGYLKATGCISLAKEKVMGGSDGKREFQLIVLKVTETKGSEI